jgi:hypothetical protein
MLAFHTNNQYKKKEIQQQTHEKQKQTQQDLPSIYESLLFQLKELLCVKLST